MSITARTFFILPVATLVPLAAVAAGFTTNVTGIVTAVSPHEKFAYLRTGCEPCVRAEFKDAIDETILSPGDIAEISGWMDLVPDPRMRLRDAVLREVRSSLRPGNAADEMNCVPPEDALAPVATSIGELSQHPAGTPGARDFWAERVKVSGRIVDVNRRDFWVQIRLVDDLGAQVQVYFRRPYNEPLDEDLRIGAVIEAVGNVHYTPKINPWTHSFDGISNPLVFVAHERRDIVFVTHAPWWTPQRLAIAMSLALMAAVSALMFALLQRHRRHEAVRVADATLRERLRMAGSLHDSFQQLLASCAFRLQALENFIRDGRSRDSLLEQVEHVKTSLEHTQAGLRAALWSMTEEAEGPSKLSGLLKYAADRLPHWSGIVRFSFEGDERPMSRQHAGSVLMILQEAVGNALKHGGATQVHVAIRFHDSRLTVEISDNGSGFDPAAETRGLGIIGMQERVRRLNGEIAIESAKAHPTKITVRIPL